MGTGEGLGAMLPLQKIGTMLPLQKIFEIFMQK